MRLKKRVLLSFVVASAVTATSVLSANALVAQYTKLPSNADVNRLKIEQNSTLIYDTNNEIVAKQQKEQKTDTKLSEIPQEVIDAVLATEDREFYEHSGVNIKAIFRSALKYGVTGEIQGGGSTLTQQLVKRIYLSDEQSFSRKLREALLSSNLESQLSKDEILTNYLNHIYYGESSYGVKDAILTYFGKSLEEFKKQDRITRITQAALIGGLPQRPSEYTPYKNPGASLFRRNTVLANMLHAGYITREEYEQAFKKDFLVLSSPNRVHEDEQLKYQEISQYVFEEAAEILNIPFEEVRYSGVRIYTSFNPQIYEIIRRNFENASVFPAGAKDGDQVEGGAVFGDPQTGEILALTGGRTAPAFGDFNRAYSAKMQRQAGSTFKPIAVYAPAIDTMGLTPLSLLPNSAGINFGGGYTVRNASGKYKAKVTMKEALQWSYNVPAVYTLKQMGIKTSKDYLKQLGIDLSADQSGLSMALGGLETGVSPLQMADAYQPFANGGYRIPFHIIKRIVSNDNTVIYDVDRMYTKDNQIFKPETIEHMRYMLKEVVDRGTGQRAKVEGQFIAGKTGTTQHTRVDSANNDVWFVGFSQYFVGSIWMGFDHSSDSHYITTSHNSAQMFGNIMKELTVMKPDNLSNTEETQQPTEAELNLEASYDVTASGVVLRWPALDNAVYDVIKNGEKLEEGITATSVIDRSVEKDKSYQYEVIAYTKGTANKVGQSNEVTFTVPTQTALGEVKEVKPTVKSTEISFVFEKVDGAESYIVKRDGAVVYEGTELEFTDKELQPETKYTYEFIAKHAAGESKPVEMKYTTLPKQ